MSNLEYIFKQIANKENGFFSFKEDIVGGYNGEYLPDLNYTLEINYKGCTILIQNRTGTTAEGNLICLMPSLDNSFNFQINTISHFLSWFRKRNRFKIKGREDMKKTIEKFSSFSTLKKISYSTAFEPMIKGVANEERFKIVVEYHLVFENWVQVIEPLISFCKEFIDSHYSKFKKNE